MGVEQLTEKDTKALRRRLLDLQKMREGLVITLEETLTPRNRENLQTMIDDIDEEIAEISEELGASSDGKAH